MLTVELPVHPENQVAMAQYMQNQFRFNGIKAPERHQIERAVWQVVKHYQPATLMTFIQTLYAQEPREYQYLAIDIAVRAKRIWQFTDLQTFWPLVTTKAWWDTIDIWRKVYSEYLKLHPEQFSKVGALFARQPNFWNRRISLILQLGFKNQTQLAYLEAAILFDRTTPEFFIQKAIGWALREYAKTDSDWVRGFVQTHDLSVLATNEALKKLR